MRQLTSHPTGPTASWRTVLVLLLGCLLSACGQSVLYSNLSEQQANEMMAALLSAGVSASKKERALQTEVGWEVRVSQGDFPLAMQVLSTHRLPREDFPSMCETFKKEGFASSSIEEHARYQCSLEQGIARTLSGIPGVAEARVHIALPESDPLGNENNDSSASVTIYERPGANVRDSETNIKATVKDSIKGLDDPNKVTVKFYSLGTPQAVRQNAAAGVSMAAINPTLIVIGIGALVLIGLIWAIVGRMRSRTAQAAAAQASSERVWNG